MNTAPEKPLRLLAQDDEDLQILSAHLQDAVLRVGDLAYLARQRRFVILMNRFCWECCDGLGSRVRCGLHFDDVLSVKARGIDQSDADAVLQLLALRFTPAGDGGGAVDLLLAGGGAVRLEVECISAGLTDLTGPWPATARPQHPIDSETLDGTERR
jgi:hypothetical protein